MDFYTFSHAKAVFLPKEKAEQDRAAHSVTHYGFYHSFPAPQACSMTVAIAARNVYRLYVNGEMVMHGPARTAHGYARVDEITLPASAAPVVHIAVEVAVYGDTYNGYSNSCTLEPGMLTAEVKAGDEVLSATGRDAWQVCRLTARLPRTERMSHSGLCCEIADLRKADDSWMLGACEAFTPAVPCDEPIYLKRRAPLPTFQVHAAHDLLSYGSCRIDPAKPLQPAFWNRPAYTPAGYYDSLPVHAYEDCLRTVEDNADCALRLTRSADGALTLCGDHDKYLCFDMEQSRVGFICIDITAEQEGIADIVRTEALEQDGSFALMHNVVTRLYLKKGRNRYITFEPGLARYLKLYLRGAGDITLHSLSMRDYIFPDAHKSAFLCSDENINRLYQAAKRTLLLNTLDVFMDCPDRERGGWLCDSLWTARAAYLMLSDTDVERDFIENFLLTKDMCKGFFPEVYPGNSPTYSTQVPITTWSFWLMCELCEYVARTGDKALALEHTARIEEFVRGSSSFIGPSGLIERMPGTFIDWSNANSAEYQRDVSTAANALYAFALQQLGKLYDRPDWVQQGDTMRGILRNALLSAAELPLHKLTSFPDGFTVHDDGTLTAGSLTSEAALYTALWSGLFSKDEAPALYRTLRDTMGPAPRFPANPNIGASGLFIGLCIRLDLLSKCGAYDTLFADLNAIYQPQLREGPGTLWENSVIDASSRCHGFNAHAGVHLLRDVLGMGEVHRMENGRLSLTIAPHPCGLRWAKGTMTLPEGILSAAWRYDGESFHLEVHLPQKERFDVTVHLPAEARALAPEAVVVHIR